MKNAVENLKNLTTSFLTDANKAAEGNKAAGARARKTSLEIEKALKDFRKVSIAEAK